MTMPASLSRVPTSPPAPNAASRPMPATAGGRTSGSSTSVIASVRPRNARVARRPPAKRAGREEVPYGGADDDEEDVGDAFPPHGPGERVAPRRGPQEVRDPAERHLGEQRDDRQGEERQRDAGGEPQEDREPAPAT